MFADKFATNRSSFAGYNAAVNDLYAEKGVQMQAFTARGRREQAHYVAGLFRRAAKYFA